MKNKDFIVDGKKIGYFDDGMIVVFPHLLF